MRFRRRGRLAVAAGAGLLVLMLVSAVSAGAHSELRGGISRGPSTTTDPYVIPVTEGVHVKSLLTVGDAGAAGNGYEMTGIPDGLGARKTSGHGLILNMNQELTATAGVARAHGQKGAFVSKLEIDARTFEVAEGSDFIQPGVRYWNYVTQTYATTPSPAGTNPRNPADTFIAQTAAFSRFCSSNLTDPGQLYDKRTKRGYKGQIYFANEESGSEGRTFGVTEDGQAQQLPRLGQLSWENTLVAHTDGDTTLSIGQEDGAEGQLWAYTGQKQSTGNAFDRAGLTNGGNHVVDLVDETISGDVDFRAKYGKNTPVPFDLAEVDWDQSGARQQAEAKVDGLSLNRIEDGAWDPRHPNDFYFVTTEGGKGADVPTGQTGRDGGGIWRLRFDDVDEPLLGGTLTLLLDGSEAPFLNKPDNVDVDSHGNLLIQEDPGNNNHVARIVAYDTRTGDRGVVATFDPALFAAGAPGLITTDEESSGIIDAKEVLGDGWFLFDAQVHRAHPDPALVEHGQLLAMRVPDFDDVYTIDD